MRLHPTTGFILERHVPPGGAVLCNVYLPARTVVGVNAWAIHREKSIYGEDADYFRPERWLEATGNDASPNHDQNHDVGNNIHGASKQSESERVAEMRRCFFMFGHGARACLGRNIAMMQIVKLVFELYRQFDISLAAPEDEWEVEGGWLTKQTKMDMVFAERTM